MNYQNTSEKWIEHYCSSHKILLVGEGDFSFAVCLAKAFGSAFNMVATSLDSEDEVMKKYPKTGSANLRELNQRGCTVYHGIDACKLEFQSRLYMHTFDIIVFNFPHAGFALRDCDSEQIKNHRNLVKEFLRSARGIIKTNGQVHVTHKQIYPFWTWEIEKLAVEVGYSLKEKADFDITKYPGYENKKGAGYSSDGTFPVGTCSTYKFVKA